MTAAASLRPGWPELHRAGAESSREARPRRSRAPDPPASANVRRPPQEPAANRSRAIALLFCYLLGCALVAAVLAFGLGAVGQELLGWVQSAVAPEPLPR